MNYRIRIRNSARDLIWIRIRIRISFWIRYSPSLINDQMSVKSANQVRAQHNRFMYVNHSIWYLTFVSMQGKNGKQALYL